MKQLCLPLLLTIAAVTCSLAQTNYYVDDNPAITTCSGTITAPFITLQDALAVAMSGDTIFVATGTYYPDVSICGTNNTNIRNNSFSIPDSVVVMGGYNAAFNARDFVTTPSILSGDIDQMAGNASNSYHVVRTNGVSPAALLDGFIVTGGNADDIVFQHYKGGGMYNDNSSPTITNVTFTGNRAVYGGGCTMITAHPPSPTSPLPAIGLLLTGGGCTMIIKVPHHHQYHLYRQFC